MFVAQELEFEYHELEPSIGADTMEVHHDKHYKGYTSNLNAALEGHDDLQEKSIEELLSNLEDLPSDIRTAVRNNGGGYYNHTLFFESLSPNGGGEPADDLMEAIEDEFGSFEDFKAEFATAAKSRFGSGWAWLVQDSEGQLEVLDTPNQDNPLMQGSYTILLGLDVWEHAYYLNYKNDRGSYIDNFWDVVDWSKVGQRYQG